MAGRFPERGRALHFPDLRREGLHVPDIRHVFVLMLENRSFDHLLGFSNLEGHDAVTGARRKVNGLSGQANTFAGRRYPVNKRVRNPMVVDPGHEFTDVLEQLCGRGMTYPPGGPYPAIDNSGFVENFANLDDFQDLHTYPWPSELLPEPGDVMKCFPPGTPRALTQLAREFVVCDSWFSSMPGPTWPNRFFAVAGTSGGLDHMPDWRQFDLDDYLVGFRLPRRSIFQQKSVSWRIYRGDRLFTFVNAIAGVHVGKIRPFERFDDEVNDRTTPYKPQFTWIEPDYGNILGDFSDGSSQHPLDDYAAGDLLIKRVYDTIRRSDIWRHSLLIVTWDEHGGFYDHVAPPACVSPNDGSQHASWNHSKFAFNQYGPRVPAVIVSPYIARNCIDSRAYDHTSILATVRSVFGLAPFTDRDANARSLHPLVTLDQERGSPDHLEVDGPEFAFDSFDIPYSVEKNPEELVGQRRSDPLPGFMYLATRTRLQLTSDDNERRFIFEASQAVTTRAEASEFLEQARQTVLQMMLGVQLQR